MDECIDSLGNATDFSTIGACSGYRQIELKDAELEKVAFALHHDLNCFIWIAFDLQNALAHSSVL